MGDIVIEGGSSDDSAPAAEATEAAAEAVEAAAEAVEAAADATGGGNETDLSFEHRLTVIEQSYVTRQEFDFLSQRVGDVQATAGEALEEALEAPDLNDVENMIEATDFTEKDGEIEADAPDVPPSGVGTSILFDNWSGLKSRFGKKVSEQ
jgi:hypothetical protein